MGSDDEFSAKGGLIPNSYFSILKLASTDSEAYGIDRNQGVVEEVSLVVLPLSDIELKRTFQLPRNL